MPLLNPGPGRLRATLYRIIFEADTPAGKTFDVVLLYSIGVSVLAVMLESVAGIRDSYGDVLRIVEWAFTILFTVEYGLRVFSVDRPWHYARSFYGIVDLLAIVPTFLSVMVPGAQTLLVVRTLRLLRVYRVLKLMQYMDEARVLRTALMASRPKITVFLGAVLAIVVIVGTMMYLIEGESHGFSSIPESIYWAVVTMTTVGYGDITPQTVFGRALASVLMVVGYGVIAVPTGIVSVELSNATRQSAKQRKCASCGESSHDKDAAFCKACGKAL